MDKNDIKEYEQVEQSFYEDLLSQFKGDLVFYSATGSLARGDIIPKWSDIDVIFVFKKWNTSTFRNISTALLNNKSSIKIGTTFYSVNEFNNRSNLDPKTFNALRFIADGLYKPRVCYKQVNITNPTDEVIEKVNAVEFSKNLHSFKREILKGTVDSSEYIMFKTLTIMFKIMLLRKGVRLDGYKKIWKKAFTDFDLGEMEIITPEIILESPQMKEARINVYINFLVWLEQKSRI